jgi:hypothetical protein
VRRAELTPLAHWAQAGLVLRARVARCVDGLDLALYEEALAVRRQFEAAQTLAAPQT